MSNEWDGDLRDYGVRFCIRKMEIWEWDTSEKGKIWKWDGDLRDLGVLGKWERGDENLGQAGEWK